MKNKEMFDRLVKLVHTIRCRKRHAEDMEVFFQRMRGAKLDICCFYLEESIAESESLPDHQLWVEETLTLMKHLGTDDPLTAADAVYKALEVVHLTTRVLSEHPNAKSLVLELLHQTEEFQAD